MRVRVEPCLVSGQDVRDLLGMSPTTFFRLLAGGKLPPSVVIGRRRYWRKETLEAWLAEKEAESAKGGRA